MKKLLLFSACFFLPLLYSLNPLPQQQCIEIKDRMQIPAGVYDLLKNYKILLIGEMHGTNETPEFVNGVVNRWLYSGEKVVLALEISKNTQSKIDSFMLTGDFTPVKKSAFFNNSFKSGTSSVAMAELIKSCYHKPNLKIVCICDDRGYRNKDWDSTMAINEFNALKLHTSWKLISLTGNIHNRMDSNEFGKPMGYWLYKIPGIGFTREEIASVNVVYDSGTAWNCNPECGIHQQPINKWKSYSKCSYDNSFTIDSYRNMYFYTKSVTASLPLNP